MSIYQHFKKSRFQNFKMLNFRNFKISNFQKIKFSKIQVFKISNVQNFAVQLRFGSTNKRKVVTKHISYNRYREILFQKVASGYLPHFAQDGSSKNALENKFLRTNTKKQKLGENDVYIPPLTPDQPPFPLRGGCYLC